MKSIAPVAWLVGALLSPGLGMATASAQIVPDSTLPIPSRVTPGCTTCTIDGGTTRGVNLFHSFREFSIPTGGAAWFNNSSNIQNILTRVTGSSISNIDGLIRANGTANLFLLNPNGIVFGQNARLQIGGSFFASTASSFKFPDGSEFSAVNPQAPPLLTVSVPLGLQYGTTLGEIRNAGDLQIPAGQSLTLFGSTVTHTGTLKAEGGMVQVLGDRVALLDRSNIDVSSPTGGGTIRVGEIFQGQGTLPTATATYIAPTATLRADAEIQGNGGRIIAWGNQSLKAYGTLTARGGSQGGNGGLVETSSAGFLDVLGIQVDAAALRGTAGTWLIDPRNITIQAIATSNGTFSGTNPDIFTPTGDDAIIATTDIQNRLDAGTSVVITTANTGTQAGNITIADNITQWPFSGPTSLTLEAANDIILQPGVRISASFVPSIASPLNLTLTADRDNSGSGSVVINGNIFTNGGAVNVSGRSVSLTNGSISSGIPGTPDAGVSGGAGAITIAADTVTLDNSRLQADTYGGGNGNPITINANQVLVNNNSSISTITWTATNNAGAIQINAADSLAINANSTVFSTSNGFSATQAGDAGFVTLNGGVVAINQSFVSSTGNAQNRAGIAINATTGSVDVTDSSITSLGRGGNGAPTTITARDRINFVNSSLSSRGLSRNAGAITLDGQQVAIQNSTILAQSFFVGTAGVITIRGRDAVAVTDNSRLSSETYGSGDSGALIVQAGNNLLVQNSELSSSTYRQGNSGQLTLQAKTIDLADQAQVLSVVRANGGIPNASGNGGQIVLDGQTVNLSGQSTLSASTFGDGNAGSIRVQNADTVSLNDSSISSAVGAAATGNGGQIELQMRSLDLARGASIVTSTQGVGSAGNIQIAATDGVTLADAQTGIFASATPAPTVLSSQGNAGIIAIQANSLAVNNGAQIAATTTGAGQAGNIQVNVNTLNASNGGQLSTITSGSGSAGDIRVTASQGTTLTGLGSGLFASTTNGIGGNIAVTTGQFVIANGAALNATTTSTNPGGNIAVNATRFDASSGGQLLTTTTGAGKAGDITLNVGDRTRLNDSGTGLFANTSDGPGGEIAITANAFEIGNGAVLNTTTTSSNPSGNIAVNAITFDAVSGGRLLTTTSGAGKAGDITLDVRDRVSLTNSGTGLFAGTSGGQGGAINVTTNTFQIADGAVLDATTRSNSAGGNITLTAQTVSGTGGSQLRTTTFGNGNAGNITLNVRDDLRLSEQGTGLFASTAPGSSGAGGDIAIRSTTGVIQNGAKIAVDSQGSGIGGSISWQGNRLNLFDQGSITAETASSDGGNITLDVRDLILLRRNSLISATAGTAQAGGDGGNITIRSGFIVGVLGENSDIVANAFTGRGGNITITTNAIFGLQFQPRLTPFSDITASSQLGISGTVTLNTLNVDPNRGLVALPVALVDPSNQINLGCAPTGKLGQSNSQFTVTGRGGLPDSPEDVMGGDRALINLVELVEVEGGRQRAEGSQPVRAFREMPQPSPLSPPHSSLIEAQGWQTRVDGTVYLVARPSTGTSHAGWQPSTTCKPND